MYKSDLEEFLIVYSENNKVWYFKKPREFTPLFYIFSFLIAILFAHIFRVIK
jgi:hypothetical protein